MEKIINWIKRVEQRGLFRVAGLYVAVIWLLIQVSDVIFPIFDIPDSVVKYLLTGSFIVFPLVIIFTWFFEITDQGLQLESDVEKSGAKRVALISSTHIILVLAVALSISVFLNFYNSTQSIPKPIKLVTVLIADFNNKTQDPIFNGTVEEALTIGMESASFVTSFDRRKALKIAKQLKPSNTLTENNARLVAVREGIDLVLVGTISSNENKYGLSLKAINPKDGEIVAESQAEAKDKLAVLNAVVSLSIDLREDLGESDASNKSDESETFTVTSLKAMQFYTQAQDSAKSGNNQQAVKLYEQAIAIDEHFGRAYSGLALSEFQLGHRVKAQKLWKQALTFLADMTPREKYRTLGLYYMRVSQNYIKAVENYNQLIEEFPGDKAGRSNLAVAYFMLRQFKEAFEVGEKAVKMFPDDMRVQSNFALYAMYAGQFELAKTAAEELITNKNVYFKAYLPLAVSYLAKDNIADANKAYEQMKALGGRGLSLGFSGLADVALYQENYLLAIDLLQQGILEDNKNQSSYSKAAKYNALAVAYHAIGDELAAGKALKNAASSSQAVSQQVPVALLSIQLGEFEKARDIATELSGHLQKEDRAYAKLIDGSLLLKQGKVAEAIDKLLAGSKESKIWLIHFELGKAYFQAGAFAEAYSEFEWCNKQIGAATSLYLDDLPTFYYSASLKKWIQKVEKKMEIVINKEDKSNKL